MAKQIVKINKCFDDTFWYKDKINEQFEVSFIDNYNNFYVVDMCDGKGSLGSVNPDDCEVCEVEEFLKELPKTEAEITKERITLLEQALNDFILGGI